MLKRILVPLDGSERAERGLAVATRLARGSGSELFIVRVISVPNLRFAPYGEPAQIALALIATAHEEADDYLKRVSKSPAVEGISVVTRAVEGHVTADILDMARDEQCDLIVICTHGHTGFRRWRLGRVATHVARHAPVPVLIIPEHDAQPSASAANTDMRILVTLDGSELAEAAIPPALDLAHALAMPERVTVHLLQVVDFFTTLMADIDDDKTTTSPAPGAEEHALEVARNYLKGLADRIQQENPGMSVTSTATLAADVAETISAIAERQPRFDYIAMATHGRGGLQRWALGSITERVLQSTQLPLLIARSPVAIARDNEIVAADGDTELRG